MSFTCFNGAFMEGSKASVPLNDRGFLFGDGVFTTLHLDHGSLEFFEEHLNRLLRQCSKMNIISPSISLGMFQELIHLNQAFTGRWRIKIIVTGGSGEFLDLRERKGDVWITMRPYTPPAAPLRLKSLLYQPSGLLAGMKTLSFYERLILKQKALEHGYDDLLTIDAHGRIGEAAFANLLFVKGKRAWIPANSELEGIMIRFIKGLLKERGYEVIEDKEMTLNTIPEAALFLCNSLMRICPVSSIDGRKGSSFQEEFFLLEEVVLQEIRSKFSTNAQRAKLG